MKAAARGFVAAGFRHVALASVSRGVRSYREDRLAGSGLESCFDLEDKADCDRAREMIDAVCRAADLRRSPEARSSFAAVRFDARSR